MIITAQRVTAVVTAWLALFVALSLAHFSPLGLLNIVGFPFLLLVPGYLTVLLLRLAQLRGAVKILLAVGLSGAELTTVAFLGNEFLPLAHIARPLDTPV